jgi:alpha/beta hydrolase family protein
MGESQIEGCARDQLERRQLVGGGGAGAPEEAHHVLDPAEPEESGFDFARLGKELHRRGSDDAEGALAADEELLQIVAGIVLAQAAKAVPNPSVGQHHLEAQCQLAGIAVAQDRDAAGVGRQIAADLTGPLGPEAEREQSVGLGGRLLQVREDVAVPVATYTGWALRAETVPQDADGCDASGQQLPFATTRTARLAAGDPRPSLEERYPDHATYVSLVTAAAQRLEQERLLLGDDVQAYIAAAQAASIP